MTVEGSVTHLEYLAANVWLKNYIWRGEEEGEKAENKTKISDSKHNKRKREQKKGVGRDEARDDSGCGKRKEAGRMGEGSKWVQLKKTQ